MRRREKIETPPPSNLDRLISWVDPVRGLKRRKARTMLAFTGGYKGGSRDRRMLRSFKPGDDSADAAILPDLTSLRNRSRDLARNAPVATGAINTVVRSVVGDGLQLKPEIDHEFLGLDEDQAREWERTAAREYAIFCETADFASVQSFADMQAMLLRTVMESGDVLVVRRFREDFGDVYGLKLQVVEADRISNPSNAGDGVLRGKNRIFGGVEIGPEGRHMAYHVSSDHPGALSKRKMKWRRIPARFNTGLPIALHLYDRTRPGQSRGVPMLAPVIEALKQIEDYSEAEISAAVISAMFTVFVTSDLEGDLLDSDPDKVVTNANDEVALGNGAVVDLAPGEKIDFANPSRPNDKFEPFMHAVLRQIGAALEIPFELLIMHFTASYSASRAALEMAWQSFRKRRKWLQRSLCQPVYEWMLEEAIGKGRISAPGFFADPAIRLAYCRCDWIGPSRIQIDPLKEANADAKDIETGVKTRGQVVMERTGGTWEQKHEQLALEERRRREDGITTAQPASQAGFFNDQNETDEGEEDGE